jgi:hypothetical protein
VPDGFGKKRCQVDNACPDFKSKLEMQDLHQILNSCGSADGGQNCAAFTEGEPQTSCYTSCVASKLAISEDCASCYAYWWLTCLKVQCLGLNCQDAYSADCVTCCNEACLDYFKQCTGFATCPAAT